MFAYYLILAGISLVLAGVKKWTEDSDGDAKVGWHDHQLNKLAQGEPPARLEEKMRSIAREENIQASLNRVDPPRRPPAA